MLPLSCTFCDSPKLSLLYSNQYHRVKKDHGPIDFYICEECGSGVSLPTPTTEQLDLLYKSFANGMDNFTREIRDSNPLDLWFEQCIDRALEKFENKKNSGSAFTWMDIGAGQGEISKILSKKYPNSKGLAIDFHARPASLAGSTNVEWVQCDLNHLFFSQKIEWQKADLILSITVLEHVVSPQNFINNILPLLCEDGVLYLTVPDFSSAASKILRSKWPYLILGEHLNIPSIKGIEKLLGNQMDKLNLTARKQFFSKRIILPYTLGYYLHYFRLPFLRKLLPTKAALKISTGILEAGILPKKT